MIRIRTFVGLFSAGWLAVLAAPPAADAATIQVPLDAPTIQGAIDVAVDGDTVLVAPGTYVENIDFLGKAITVQSQAGPEVTIIDGGERGSVVTFSSGEGPASVLKGFMLRNGIADFGAGIRVGSPTVPSLTTSPTITSNDIVGNRACSGAGIGVAHGAPRIEDNDIRFNRQSDCSGGNGGGIAVLGAASAAEIAGNRIFFNTVVRGHGGGIYAAGRPVIRDNRIRYNNAQNGGIRADLAEAVYAGGGIYLADVPEATLAQNLLVRNYAIDGGGIFFRAQPDAPGALLVANTLLANRATGEDTLSGAPGNGTHADGISANGFLGQTRLVNNIIAGRVAIHCAGTAGTDPPPSFEFNNIMVGLETLPGIIGADGSYDGYGGICLDQTGIAGNLSADPLVSGLDSTGFRPPLASPVVDAANNAAPGLPATDLGGLERVVDGNGDGVATADMGAFEARNQLFLDIGSDRKIVQGEILFLGPWDELNPLEAYDPLGGPPSYRPLAYSWSLDGAVVSTSEFAEIGPLAAGTYTVALTITDLDGGSTSDSFTLNVIDGPANSPPLAIITGNQIITSDVWVDLQEWFSIDPEGDYLSSSWQRDGVAIDFVQEQLPPGTYTYTLTVTDPQGAGDTDTAVVTVLARPNSPPLADAGPDQTALPTETVRLDGSGSSDPDGDWLQYVWTLDGVVIATTGPSATVGPFDQGTYTIALTVSDGFGGSAADTMVLTVANGATP